MSIDFGRLDDQNIDFLEVVPWHLETFSGDNDRLRVVYPTIGMAGRWFSVRWTRPLGWDNVKPSVDYPKCRSLDSPAYRQRMTHRKEPIDVTEDTPCPDGEIKLHPDAEPPE